MNNGLKILIERMREFPGDFDRLRVSEAYTNREDWRSIHQQATELCNNEVFPEEDIQAFREATRQLMIDMFEARVLDALSPPKEPTYEPTYEISVDSGLHPQYRAIGKSAALGSGYGLISNTNTAQLKIGSTGLSESDILTIKAKAGLK